MQYTHFDSNEAMLAEIGSGRLDQTVMIAKAHAPYDGCFWCWVYAFVDEGKLVWASDPRRFDRYRWLKDASDLEVFDELDSFDFITIENLPSNIAGSAVRPLYEVAEETGVDWFRFPCSDCGNDFGGSDDILYHDSGYHSEGGISIVAGDPLCQECYDKLEENFWEQELRSEFETESQLQRYFELAHDSNVDRCTPDSIDWDLVEKIKTTLYLDDNGVSLEDEEGNHWQVIIEEVEPGHCCEICEEEIQRYDYYCPDTGAFACSSHVERQKIEDPDQITLPFAEIPLDKRIQV